jgi:hypothetical protein
MLVRLLACLGLLAITVAVHSTGLVLMLRWIVGSGALAGVRLLASTWLLIRVVWSLMALHVIEIGVWAAFYWWQGCMPDIESAIYFSGVTYASIGYGDLLLPVEWRFFGPVEGLAGILMCGLSTGFFFATMSQIHRARANRERP